MPKFKTNMLDKIKNLLNLKEYAEENKKRFIILSSLIGVFLIFGIKGLLLFVGGGAVYHILSNRYGLKV